MLPTEKLKSVIFAQLILRRLHTLKIITRPLELPPGLVGQRRVVNPSVAVLRVNSRYVMKPPGTLADVSDGCNIHSSNRLICQTQQFDVIWVQHSVHLEVPGARNKRKAQPSDGRIFRILCSASRINLLVSPAAIITSMRNPKSLPNFGS